MYSDKYRNLVYFKNSKDVFAGVDIRGGVGYYLKDYEYSGDCHIVCKNKNGVVMEAYRKLANEAVDNFVEDEIAIKIITKCKTNKSFQSIVGPVHAYGIETNTITVGSGIKVYRNYGQIDQCSIDEIPRVLSSIYKYKVIAVYAFGKGILGERVPKPKVIGPMEICPATYLVVGESEDKKYCENIAKYIQTNLFSLLVGLTKATQIAPKQVYKYVPLQDFTLTSDIDWDQHKKYNLTQQEIDYIESTIKPMA